jgi:hypothetical protein
MTTNKDIIKTMLEMYGLHITDTHKGIVTISSPLISFYAKIVEENTFPDIYSVYEVLSISEYSLFAIISSKLHDIEFHNDREYWEKAHQNVKIYWVNGSQRSLSDFVGNDIAKITRGNYHDLPYKISTFYKDRGLSWLSK